MKNQSNWIDNLKYGMNIQAFADNSYQSIDDPALQAQIMEMMNGTQTADPTQTQTIPAASAPQGAVVPNPETGVIPQGESSVTPNDPASANPQTDPSASGQPVPGPAQQGLLGGKFNSVDELLNAYQNLESFSTRKAQEAAEFKAAAEKLQNQSTQVQDPAPQAQISPDGQGDPNAVDPFSDSETLAELLYSDPVKAFKMMEDRILTRTQKEVFSPLEQKITPIVQQSEEQARMQAWKERVDDFSAQHQDIQNWTEPMSRILIANPALREDPNGLEIAYQAAKGQQYQPPADPAVLLQDESFVKTNILGNKAIRDQFIQEYLTELQNGGSPVVIGQTATGGSATLTPPKRPANMEEADEMTRALFGK